jgi:hypothetical protein
MEPKYIRHGLTLETPIERLNYLRGYAEANGFVCIDKALVEALYNEMLNIHLRWNNCLAHIERLDKKQKGTK